MNDDLIVLLGGVGKAHDSIPPRLVKFQEIQLTNRSLYQFGRTSSLFLAQNNTCNKTNNVRTLMSWPENISLQAFFYYYFFITETKSQPTTSTTTYLPQADQTETRNQKTKEVNDFNMI